jgi:hypothetical protein
MEMPQDPKHQQIDWRCRVTVPTRPRFRYFGFAYGIESMPNRNSVSNART